MARFFKFSVWLVFLSILALFSSAFCAEDELVSLDDNENPIGGSFSSISADGRYVAFSKVPFEKGYGNQVYVRDRQTGRTELVSVSSEGVPANDTCLVMEISVDGRYVTFYSYATNLVPSSGEGLFIRDRVTGKTEKIDVSMKGGQLNVPLKSTMGWGIQVTMSSDGRFVAFNTRGYVFVRDRVAGVTELVSVDNSGAQLGYAYSSAISADGRFIAFFYGYNGQKFLCIRDRLAGTTERTEIPSVNYNANIYYYQKLSISADGRFVAFSNTDILAPSNSNGPYIFIYDRQSRSFEKVSTDTAVLPSLSADGRNVMFYSRSISGGSSSWDVAVYDRSTGVIEHIPVSSVMAWPSISANGRFVAYPNYTAQLGRQIYLHDRQTITANAGPDQTVEETFPAGATVTLDGSASTSGCSDPLTYAWTWSGGSAEGVKPTMQLPVGETTVTLTVSACGTSATDTVVVKVADTLPPVSSATVTGTKGSGDWFVSGATVSITANDSGSGVKEIRYRVNGGEESTISGAAGSFPLSAEGVYILTYYAVDNAGIPEGEKLPLNVKVDMTPPVSAVTVSGTPGLNGWYTSAATLSFTASDNLSGVRELHYSSNPSSEIVVTGAAAGLTLTADGSYNVSYYAIDTAGNVEIPQKNQAVNIDATPPNIIIGGVSNNTTYSLGLVPVASYTVSDSTSGVAASNATLTGGDAFGLGTFTYTVTAADNAGNPASANVTYDVIATPEGLNALIGQMLASGKIDNAGIANSLISKVQNAQKANGNAADNIMQAFINQVEAQSGKHIASDAAAILIHAAEYIIGH